MKECLRISFGIILLCYAIGLLLGVAIQLDTHGCKHAPLRRIDYVFPAIPIACFLEEEVK